MSMTAERNQMDLTHVRAMTGATVGEIAGPEVQAFLSAHPRVSPDGSRRTDRPGSPRARARDGQEETARRAGGASAVTKTGG